MNSNPIKHAIHPIQMWLLSQHRCVACGKDFSKNPHKKHPQGEIVTCDCGRSFIKQNNSYRRALQSEIK